MRRQHIAYRRISLISHVSLAWPRPGWGSLTREMTGLAGVGRDAMASTCMGDHLRMRSLHARTGSPNKVLASSLNELASCGMLPRSSSIWARLHGLNKGFRTAQKLHACSNFMHPSATVDEQRQTVLSLLPLQSRSCGSCGSCGSCDASGTSRATRPEHSPGKLDLSGQPHKLSCTSASGEAVPGHALPWPPCCGCSAGGCGCL